MKREELLTDAMLFFSPNERSITVENGARYYREDVVLKAMELAGKETPLPPAEGAEEILHKYVHTINSDGTSLVTFMGALKAMREFAAQQKPTSSATAEEILQKYMDMSMIICPLHVVPRTVALDAMHEFAALQNKPQPTAEGAEEIKTLVTQWEQFKNERWWNSEAIDVLAVLINEFSLSAGYSLRHDATLHAQKIADKMVEERLEIELIKYDTWLCSHSDVVISKHYNINEYLKSREK